MSTQTEIENLYATAIEIAAIPGLRILAEINSRPEGEYIDGRSSAIKAVLRELHNDGVPSGARILVTRAFEPSVTFVVLDNHPYSGGYCEARVKPGDWRVTAMSPCGETPVAQT
jgi:hypothetical protein